MVYTKLEGLHQTGGFTQTWKLEGLHKTGGFTQTCSIYCGRQNYKSYCIQPLPHKTRGFTQTCSSYCSSFKWQESLTAFNLCPTKLEGLHCNIWTAMLQSLLYFSCNHRLNSCESILVTCSFFLVRVCKFNAESIFMTCKLLIHQQQSLLQPQTTAQVSMDVMLNKILTFHSILLLLTK